MYRTWYGKHVEMHHTVQVNHLANRGLKRVELHAWRRFMLSSTMGNFPCAGHLLTLRKCVDDTAKKEPERGMDCCLAHFLFCRIRACRSSSCSVRAPVGA